MKYINKQISPGLKNLAESHLQSPLVAILVYIKQFSKKISVLKAIGEKYFFQARVGSECKYLIPGCYMIFLLCRFIALTIFQSSFCCAVSH